MPVVLYALSTYEIASMVVEKPFEATSSFLGHNLESINACISVAYLLARNQSTVTGG